MLNEAATAVLSHPPPSSILHRRAVPSFFGFQPNFKTAAAFPQNGKSKGDYEKRQGGGKIATGPCKLTPVRKSYVLYPREHMYKYMEAILLRRVYGGTAEGSDKQSTNSAEESRRCLVLQLEAKLSNR